MKTENFKSFETKAITGKGTFEVKLNVWEEISDGKTYFVTRTWKSETTVTIDGKNFKADFNQYAPDRIKSWSIGKYFGLETQATLKCDVSEATKYINEIEWKRVKEHSEFQRECQISEMIHNL